MHEVAEDETTETLPGLLDTGNDEPFTPSAGVTLPPLKRDGRPVMNEDLISRATYCTVCTSPIPAETAKHRAITCGRKGCNELLKRMRRKPKDDRACRFCKRPATLSQRQAYARFRSWELEHPDQAHPKTWAVVQAAGVDLDTFRAAAEEAADQDFSLEYSAAALLWPRRPAKPNAEHPNLDRVLEVLETHWAPEIERIAHRRPGE